MRRVVASAAVVLFSLLLMVPASAASAAPVPPPAGSVDEIMDIPGRAAKSLTGSSMGDELLVNLFRATRGQMVAPVVPAPTAPLPGKPITPIQGLGKLAGGTAGAALAIGWAVGGNGTIGIIAAANGSSFDETYCRQPSWYQGTLAFFSLGVAQPECPALHVPTPNADRPSLLMHGNVQHFRIVHYNDVSGPAVGYCGATVYKGWNYENEAWYPGGTGPASWGVTDMRGYAAPICGATAYFSGIYSPGYMKIFIPAAQNGGVRAQLTEVKDDPERELRCKITWEDGSVSTGSGFSYRESGGLPVGATEMGCTEAYTSVPGRGPAFMPSRIEVESVDDGGAITEIADHEVPEFSPSERKAFETGNGRGLVLEKVVGTTMQSCMTWAADCSGWWSESAEGTSTTSPYRCTFAGFDIPLAECGPYRHTFDAPTTTPTITDPVTGAEHPWTSQPNTGNSISPGVGPGTGANPSAECFSSGWASVANPIEWVLVPVKCALVWAFVPRTSAVEGTVTALGASAGNVAAVDPLLGIIQSLPSMGGCAGIPITLTFFGQEASGTLLYACDGFGATAAAVVNGLLTLAVCTGALLAVTRYAAAVFGFVGPGGQIEQTQYAAMQRAARND